MPVVVLVAAILYQPVLAQVVSYPGARGAPPPSGYGVQPTYNANTNMGGTSLPLPSQPAARIASSPVIGGQTSTSQANDLVPQASSQATIRTNGLLSILREGGVLMYPILLCSFILMVFVLERLLYLRRSRVIPKPFVRGVIEQLEQQQLGQDEALELCEANGSPVAELFTAALKRWNRPAVEMEQAAMDAGAHITSRLRKYLRLFNAISNMTPLLGLLGTVLGMIDAFNSIAQADAMGRPELLAGGIGTALLTTAFGLCVAIPAYAAYVYFLGRTDKLILEMDALVANVIELTSAEAQGSRSRSRSRKAG